ncbi:MAG: hypothetical protein GEU86_15460, partial [Actinophytocola sp.]|nr:hypothetical protein [Actinophytocola sp.]
MNAEVTAGSAIPASWPLPLRRSDGGLPVPDCVERGDRPGTSHGIKDYDLFYKAGLIPENLGSSEDLALSFTGPIGLIRVLHLHADASREERGTARDQ